jgi:hypothetical protein
LTIRGICVALLAAAFAGCNGDDGKRANPPPEDAPVTFFLSFEDETQVRAAAVASPAEFAHAWGRVKAGEWLLCASRQRALTEEVERLKGLARRFRGRYEGWRRSPWPPGRTCPDEIYARQREGGAS